MTEQNPREHIGANAPPDVIMPDAVSLAMLQSEANAVLLEIDRLSNLAAWQQIDSRDAAASASGLVVELRDLWNKIEKQRVDRKEPYLRAGRMIDSFYGAPLTVVTELGQKLTRMVKLFNDRENEAAARERRRLEDEARAAERTATLVNANAQRAPMVKGEEAAVVAQRHADRAGELRTQASLTTAAPIVSATGAKGVATGKRVGTIENFDKALAWAVTFDAPSITEALQKVIDRAVRAKIATIPGVAITTEDKLVIRR